MQIFGLVFIRLQRWLMRLRHGLKPRSWQGEGFNIVYLESKKAIGSPLIFLHGLGASKDQWGPHIYELAKEYHCIFIDLPGEGESSYSARLSYSVESQTARLTRFLKSKRFNKITLFGSSIGGTIATEIAIQSPSLVDRLVVFSPAGLKGEKVTSVMSKFICRGEHPFGYRDADEMRAFWHLIFNSPPEVPRFIQLALAKKGKLRYPKINKIVADYVKFGVYQLQDRINNLKSRTLVVWGEDDKIFHASCAVSVKCAIENIEVEIVQNSGHVPYLERGEQVLNRIKLFLSG